jgi:uncharacterized lipoprotein YmbA
MRTERLRLLTVLLLVLLLFVDSCSPFGPGTQQKTKLYVLSSLQSAASQEPPLAVLPDIGLGIGPIRMPLYLDRSDIVTRDSQNQVVIAEFAQWAGPLQENFSRVLAENLSVLLATDRVAVFPFARSTQPDYNVTVYITRFDGTTGDKAHLRARWTILDNKRKNSLFEKHTIVSEPTQDDNMESLIAAESRAVAHLSREIAQAIKEVSSKYPKQKKDK